MACVISWSATPVRFNRACARARRPPRPTSRWCGGCESYEVLRCALNLGQNRFHEEPAMPMIDVTFVRGSVNRDARSGLTDGLVTALLRAKRAADTPFPR